MTSSSSNGNKGGTMKRYLFIFCICFLLSPITTWAESIVISVENREFYPFFFVEKGTAKGLLLDMVKDGLKPFDIEPIFKPLPLKRGLKMIERGKVDAIIAPRIKNDTFLLPDDAFEKDISSQRILQIDSVVVTYKSDYEFLGNIKTLPTPIRLTLGDPIESLFKSHGLSVDDGASGEHNIKKLMRDKKGCVITTSFKAMTWLENPNYMSNIDVSTEPVISRSYFLIFSKNSGQGKDKITQVWNEISKNRDDYIYPIKLFTAY
ncbi:MAG: amino acid ABC transporter periplasmic protein [Candidatus Magnetoglobus multicellularis str. Araruama]|uniref:Amino acid ABC transporter periplasmic protein n=1 Tax=Candidatus Magnetoglobus multicellularis str. Araruama TaxID=890399 RepID=A0A1V1PC63_9BACT|nr:MAG: amino acid ABC transporter periplasmic protein [Candidatus Magnetoglobus multicellularis str. Araruama]